MNKGGFSEARLGRMRDVMNGHVERGIVPGIVTLVSRRGEVHVEAVGTKAFGSSDPMRRDTICERDEQRSYDKRRQHVRHTYLLEPDIERLFLSPATPG
jgi:hypothetical protein